MDDLLHSLKSEMRQARHESCELTKTMWNLYSALEEVVDDSAPYHHLCNAPLFLKERITAKRHSLFHDRRPMPIWEYGGVFSPVTSHYYPISMPNSPLLMSNRRILAKPIYVSTPIIANMGSELDHNVPWAIKEHFLVDDLYVEHQDAPTSHLLNETVLMAGSCEETCKSSKSGQDSPASSGYSSGEASPTDYKKADTDDPCRNDYEDHRSHRHAIPNFEAHIDNMCHHIYENLGKCDTREHKLDQYSHVTSRSVSCGLRSGAFTHGKAQRGTRDGNSTPQSIRAASRQFTPPARRERNGRVAHSSIQPAVVDMSPNMYSDNATGKRYDCQKELINTNYRVTPIDVEDHNESTSILHWDEYTMGTLNSKTVEDLELDAEVAYIMSKLDTQERSRKVRGVDTEKSLRRPSLSSDAADSGRGSLMSSSPHCSDSKYSKPDLSFRPVEHIYETIPGEIVTPVVRRKSVPVPSRCPVDLDMLEESAVDSDHDGECSQAPSDNTYASLNVSRMLDDALVATLPPPTPPTRRYTCNTLLNTVQTRTATIRETDQSCHPRPPGCSISLARKSKINLNERSNDLNACNRHVYTVEDVLESVDRLAGHLPKSRDNLYYLVTDRDTRRRLSKCLREPSTSVRQVEEEKSNPHGDSYFRQPPPKPQRWDPLRTVDSSPSLSRNRHASAGIDVPHPGTDYVKKIDQKPTVRKSRRSLPVGSFEPRQVRTVWKRELLKEHAIFC